jgi:hypothetical protein
MQHEPTVSRPQATSSAKEVGLVGEVRPTPGETMKKTTVAAF